VTTSFTASLCAEHDAQGKGTFKEGIGVFIPQRPSILNYSCIRRVSANYPESMKIYTVCPLK
ncbi:hypothetical protein MJM37_23960, partial [Salmonella enterica subsp. enterica serovar Anatum]|nr:hypothetical protein [Salmonella enterica subsp. enterica serovar Anatum]